MRIDTYGSIAASQLAWREAEYNRAPRLALYVPDKIAPDLQNLSVSPFSHALSGPEIIPEATPDLVVVPEREMQRGKYDPLQDQRLVFVGAGAGSVILASYLALRGADPTKMTFIDPQPTGGIWNNANVLFGGFNNPAPLRFNGLHQLDTTDRSGEHMLNFITNIAADYLCGSERVLACAQNLAKRRFFSREWRVGLNNGDSLAADAVVLATGRPVPRKLDSPRIKSNLDTVTSDANGRVVVEHEQRALTDAELSSGRSIVLVGLGNSTAAMLNHIQKYEDRTGKTVEYTVLTDYSASTLNNPYFATEPYGKPLFRKPAEGYLTGYSGDLARDRQSLARAIEQGNVITDVDTIVYKPETSKLLSIQKTTGRIHAAPDPHIFVLIGSNKDAALIAPHTKGVREPIRACDGAIYTKRDGYMSNLYAIGSFAATHSNPNAAVIPGIFAQTPGTTLTMAVRLSDYGLGR